MDELPKLNLGCGANLLPGYINVDKFGSPDVHHDLETFPWPWETDSIGEIRLSHVLEHLGPTPDQYFGIFKEMYRVCAPGAQVHIWVPHPRSDDFLGDPTHVRIVTVEGLALFSQSQNRLWMAKGNSNSPLAIYLNIDFEVTNSTYYLDEPWQSRFEKNELTSDQLLLAAKQFNNVIKSVYIVLKAIKPPG